MLRNFHRIWAYWEVLGIKIKLRRIRGWLSSIWKTCNRSKTIFSVLVKQTFNLNFLMMEIFGRHLREILRKWCHLSRRQLIGGVREVEKVTYWIKWKILLMIIKVSPEHRLLRMKSEYWAMSQVLLMFTTTMTSTPNCSPTTWPWTTTLLPSKSTVITSMVLTFPLLKNISRKDKSWRRLKYKEKNQLTVKPPKAVKLDT